MSSLKPLDKCKLEKLFEMGYGYVLRFTDKTFSDLFVTLLGFDIRDGSIEDRSLSKVKLLRAFWIKGDDQQVAIINDELLKIWSDQYKNKSAEQLALYQECLEINNWLRGRLPVRSIGALTPFESDDSIETIIKDIRHNIESNYPELTLDRLHNYLIKYGRKLCDEHGLEHTDSDTLNSLFGIYNKWLHKSELLKSKMSSKIIGTIVKLFDDFNYVRNNQSAAHPNPLLNKTESLFIVDTVCSIIEFLKRIEDVRRTP